MKTTAQPNFRQPRNPVITENSIGDFTSMCATGRQFWPMDPRPEDIDLRDIARALSMQCRWAAT